MEITKVKQLVEVLEQSSLVSLELSDGTGTIKLSKSAPVATALPLTPVPTNFANNYHETVPAQPEPAAPTVAEPQEKPLAGTCVNSPLVGTYYAKPSPEAAAFVEVGAQVKKGQVVCIIEAMKVMNEIKAPVSGTVTEIFVMTGDMVEFDTPLMQIAAE